MKRHLIIVTLVLMAMLSVAPPGRAVSLSMSQRLQTDRIFFAEDFEQWPAGVLPRGWNADNYSGFGYDSNWRVAVSTSGHCLTFNPVPDTAATAVSSVLLTPQFTLPSYTDVVLRIRIRTSAGASMGLFVSTDGGNTFLQNPIDTALSTGGIWQERDFSLSRYGGRAVGLVFRVQMPALAGIELSIDDIRVTAAPECEQPVGLYAHGITGTSASVSWALSGPGYGSIPDSFHVRLIDADGVICKDTVQSSSLGTSAVFSGLRAGSYYTAEVMGDCRAGFDGLSEAAAAAFHTAGSVRPLPYAQGFDTIDAFPDDYFTANAAIEDGVAQLISGGSEASYIVFPPIAAATDSFEMCITANNGNAGGVTHYYAGVVTDPADAPGTFTQAFSDSIATGTAWQRICFNSASIGFISAEAMPCIMVPAGSSLLVRNVELNEMPACARIERFRADDIGHNFATLSWTGSATGVLLTARCSADSSIVSATAAGSPYRMTGLQPETEYTITARAICLAGDTSALSETVTITTLCAPVGSTFTQDFNSTAANKIPACWHTGWLDKGQSTAAVPFGATSTKKMGSSGKSVCTVKQPVGTISYLATQAFEIDSAGSHDFSLAVYRDGSETYSKTEGIEIWLNNTPFDTLGGTRLGRIARYYGSYPVEAQAGWAQYQYPINATGTLYIIIVAKAENSNRIYMDNMEVVPAPRCRRISDPVVAGTSAHAATIEWTAGGREQQWTVEYSVSCAAGLVADTAVATTVPQVTISGLGSAQAYTVEGSIRSVCQSGDTAVPVAFRFTVFTDCEPLTTLPYSMDFEPDKADDNHMPICWQRLNPYVYGTTYGNYPALSQSGEEGGYLQHYQAYAGAFPDMPMAVLPEIDTDALPISSLRIRFDARLRSNGHSNEEGLLLVGVLTDPADTSSFQVVDSLLITGYTYRKHVVEFGSYSGPGRHIALCFPKPAVKRSTFTMIDNLVIEQIPLCADIVGSVLFSNQSDSAVTATINDSTALTGWSIAYGPEDTQLADMTVVEAVGQSVTLTGLAAATHYTAQIRRRCSDSLAGYWSDAVGFSTTGVPAATPYVCSFEDSVENARWCFARSGNEINFAIGTAEGGHSDGQQGLYVSSDNGNNYTYRTEAINYTYRKSRIFVYRAISFPDSLMRISFHWKCTGGYYDRTEQRLYDYGYAMIVPAGEQITGAATTTYFGDVAMPKHQALLPKGVDALYKTDGWNGCSELVDFRGRAGVYNLAFMWNNGSFFYWDKPLAIDSIVVEAVDCAYPAAVSLTNVGATTARLEARGATDCQIVLYDSAGSEANPLYVGIDSLVLADLVPNTLYYYTARSICSGSDSSAWMPVDSFRTDCAVQALPHTEDFETRDSELCWQQIAGEGSITRERGVAHTGHSALRLDRATALMPDCDIDSLTGLVITGYALASADSSRFTVGALVDPADVSTFQPLGDILVERAGQWTEFSVSFDSLALPENAAFAGARHVAIIGSIVLDDVSLAACPAIARRDVRLTVSDSSINAVLPAAGVGYQLSHNDMLTDTVAFGTSGDSMLVLSGLEPATRYYLSLWAECSPGRRSATTLFELQTPCVVRTDYPVNIDFAGEPHCWRIYTEGGTWSLDSVDDDLALSGCIGQRGRCHTLVLPPLEDVNGKLLSLWHKSKAPGIKSVLGYLSNPADSTSFIAVDTMESSTVWAQYVHVVSVVPEGAQLAIRMADAGCYSIRGIHINIFVESRLSDDICYGAGYTDNGLNVAAGSLAPGYHELVGRLTISSTLGQPDSLSYVGLNVLGEALTVLADTVCQGAGYMANGWDIPVPETRTYRRHDVSSSGCDSMEVLLLTVVPTAESRYDTICEGDSYLFGERELSTAGVYCDTVTNSRGCTSIITLHLTVVAAADTLCATICEGDYYQFHGRRCVASGIYSVAGVGARGCSVVHMLRLSVVPSDSVVNVSFCAGGSLVVADTVISTPGQYALRRISGQGCYTVYHITATSSGPLTEHIYDYVCSGRTYTGYGFSDLSISADTVLTTSGISASGCDSVALIHVSVRPTITSVDTVDIRQGDTYTWRDNTYSVAGIYRDTVVDSYGCDSVLVLCLRVGLSVDDAGADGSIRVIPNPVAAGSAAIVFTAAVGRVSRAEILNSSGSVVSRWEPRSTPVDLRAPEMPGIYHVRIITASGDVYVEKLIVR